MIEMIEWERAVAFTIAAAALVASPGPDSMLILRNTVAFGRAFGWRTMMGVQAGVATHATLAAAGVSAVLRASDFAFRLLALAGGLYLAWLGLSTVRRGIKSLSSRNFGATQSRQNIRDLPRQRGSRASATISKPPVSGDRGHRLRRFRDDSNCFTLPETEERRMRGGFRQGMLCNLLNPKVLLLFVALIPGFVDPDASAARAQAQIIFFGAVVLALNIPFQSGLVVLAASAAEWLSRPRVSKVVQWSLGAVLILFGIGIVADHALPR